MSLSISTSLDTTVDDLIKRKYEADNKLTLGKQTTFSDYILFMANHLPPKQVEFLIWFPKPQSSIYQII